MNVTLMLLIQEVQSKWVSLIKMNYIWKVIKEIHFAVHEQTAAEVIFTRADAEKEFMGLMTFSGSQPYLKDVVVTKNYLNEKELRSLGQIVSGYLDFPKDKPNVKKQWQWMIGLRI